MSDILKSIAQFVDVPAGGVVSLPHGINIKGRPETPDKVDVNNGSFTVTADELNVTVTNGSAEVASVDVLSQMWHSIPRVFGLQNQDAQDSLPVRPFVSAGAGSDLVGSDELVAASGTDTTPNFLREKLAAGNGVTLLITDEGADEKVLVSIPSLTTMQASINNLSSGMAGDIVQVLLAPAPIEVSAALLNAAAAGTFVRPFYAECRNSEGNVMGWANFDVKEIPGPNDGQYVPTEAVADADVGVPVISDSAWVNGQLTSVVIFDTDGGATKTYVPGDEVYAEVKMSATDIFLGFTIASVTQTFVVVA